jgi:ribosome biogenesis GTPase
MMTLDDLGWRSPPLGGEPQLEPGEAIGRVAVEHRAGYVVLGAAGEVQAEVTGRFRHDALGVHAIGLPAVGDWVVLRGGQSRCGGRGVIQSILPRRGVFVRKEAGRGSSAQVIAANVDFAFLVTAMTGDLNPRRLERYAAMAHEGRIAPVIVLSKADLAVEAAALSAARNQAASAVPGVPVHAVSALTGDGVDDLEAFFGDRRTIALLGTSGAGKSTLINALLGREAQQVQDLRGDGKGRHTTTRRSLFLRPGGGVVIDTPGMRELALHGSDEGVSDTFPEIAELAACCRFRDCSHRSEPGCAVQAAMREGTLAVERLASYEKLRAEIRHLEARENPKVYLERKRQEKAIHRAMYRWLDEKKWR